MNPFFNPASYYEYTKNNTLDNIENIKLLNLLLYAFILH